MYVNIIHIYICLLLLLHPCYSTNHIPNNLVLLQDIKKRILVIFLTGIMENIF